MLNLKTLTDEQLVIEFKTTGDNQIFGEIYNRYNKRVYKVCLSFTKDKTTAYDLVQDIMIKLMEKLPSLENANLLGLWIHRVANNFCVDYYKAQKRMPFDAIEDRFDLAEEEVDMEGLIERENQLDAVEDIMAELEEDTKTILQLKYLEGNSIKELQTKLDLTSSAVKMRLKRGRNKIAQLYQSQQPRVKVS